MKAGLYRCAQTLAHPRTGAVVEVIYASHGLHMAVDWAAVAVYVALLVVAVAHVLWVHATVGV